MDKQYYIYILTNYKESVLYTGVTSNLKKRIYEHKNKLLKGFSQEYNLNKLVYYEIFDDIKLAIKREKQIKGGSKQKKIDLIKRLNPEWEDLDK
ncbi:MAG: GIY-YIG nuclease family protein [Candidatus Gastranaerophilales bacterium]|nr:GIY-YIG nuclease family protein [Candidatus Gastranaerophilales bacterium]